MSIEDTKLKIPGVKVSAGQLLDTSILGISVRVPPADIVLTPDIYIDLTPIWDVIMKIMDGMAEEFYKKVKGES